MKKGGGGSNTVQICVKSLMNAPKQSIILNLHLPLLFFKESSLMLTDKFLPCSLFKNLNFSHQILDQHFWKSLIFFLQFITLKK